VLLKKFRTVEIDTTPSARYALQPYVCAPHAYRTLIKIRAAPANRQPCNCKIFVASARSRQAREAQDRYG
jgi:hypothetical protein